MQPSVIGLKKSFGFGDRLGLATPGHLAAARKYDFTPIFAQQSIREMERTQRTADEVMDCAKAALVADGFDGTWGSDADHLKTPQDVQLTAAAGFTFFTIDPSAGVNNHADSMSEFVLEQEIEAQERDGLWQDLNGGDSYWRYYINHPNHLADNFPRFEREQIWRAIVKYGRAIDLTVQLAAEIARCCARRAYEIEVSVDETESPTSPLEHYFFARELRRRGIENVVSIAPRFVGEMEKGVDYRGDLQRFERNLQQHLLVAQGSHKISVHSGSDKFSIYPIVGRVCGDLLHVKTAGTSYLEALRCVLQSDESLFLEIARFSHERFDNDRVSYHISATSEKNSTLANYELTGQTLENAYLNENVGRQILHVTFGSVLTEPNFKRRILENLTSHTALHTQLLETHFTKHLEMLQSEVR